MTANIKISIGPILEQKYSILNLAVLLTKSRIENTIQIIRKKIGIKEVPLIVLQLPHDFQGILKQKNPCQFVNFLQNMKIQLKQVVNSNKLYWVGDLKKQQKKFFNNIQQSFKQVVILDNNIDLTFNLCNVDSWHKKLIQGKPPIAVFLENAQIQGKISTDPKLVQLLNKILKELSPQFLQSPIMAGLQHFETFECQINFETFNSLGEDKVDFLFKPQKPFKQTQDILKKKLINNNSEEQIVFYFTLPKLLCIKLKGNSKIFGNFFSAFSLKTQKQQQNQGIKPIVNN